MLDAVESDNVDCVLDKKFLEMQKS